MRMLISHYILKGKLSRDNYEMSNIESHVHKFMAYVVEKNTSFVRYF